MIGDLHHSSDMEDDDNYDCCKVIDRKMYFLEIITLIPIDDQLIPSQVDFHSQTFNLNAYCIQVARIVSSESKLIQFWCMYTPAKKYSST